MQEEEDYQAVNGGTPWSVLVYFCSIDTMYCIRYREVGIENQITLLIKLQADGKNLDMPDILPIV